MSEVRLCLRTGQSSGLALEAKVQIAGQAGYRGLELGAAELEANLARFPVAWLDGRLQAHGIHTLIVAGIDLPVASPAVDALLDRARFLELCTHLDALGGGTIVLRSSAAARGVAAGADPPAVYLLRACADWAAPFEVSIAYDLCAGDGGGSVEAGHALLERVARRNVGLALGVSHLQAARVGAHLADAYSRGALKLVRLEAPPEGLSTEQPAAEEVRGLEVLGTQLAASGFNGPYSVGPVLGQGSLLERARAAREWAQGLLALSEKADIPAGDERRRLRWRLSRRGPAK